MIVQHANPKWKLSLRHRPVKSTNSIGTPIETDDREILCNGVSILFLSKEFWAEIKSNPLTYKMFVVGLKLELKQFLS